MMKVLTLFCGLLLSLINVNYSLASGFSLKSIGAIQTSSQTGHWWYTSSNPVFIGEAPPTVAVDVTIDGVTETVPTTSDGTWQYQPTTLIDGDHEIVLTNNGSKIAFKLTIGSNNVNWDSVGKSSEVLPVTGVIEMTLALVIGGLAVMALGGKIVLNASKE